MNDEDSLSSEDFDDYGDDKEDDLEDGSEELPIVTNVVQQDHHVPKVTW